MRWLFVSCRVSVGDSGALSKSMRACEEISKQIQDKFTEKMKENNVWLIIIASEWFVAAASSCVKNAPPPSEEGLISDSKN